MFSREKIVIRFNLILRKLVFHLLFWYSSLLFFMFLTGNDQLFVHYSDLLLVNSFYVTSLILAAIISILFMVTDGIFSDRFMRMTNSRLVMFLPPVIYIFIGFSLAVLSPQEPMQVAGVRTIDDAQALIPVFDLLMAQFLVYFFICSFINNIMLRMVKKVGKSNFRSWIFGMMSKPKEAERIFMFLDMKSSTRIAEQLSHQKFSQLVQDVFNDMAVFDNYMGEIYQYVGDGAIISWPLKKGLKNNNFLRGFYGFTKVINKREKYYQKRYGLTPKFKAGIHVGKVMVLQVGRIRRDISYNGDILNTTARIESMCNAYNKNLLISSDLHEMMADANGYYVKELDNIKLKGKRRKIGIFYVREKTKPVKKKVKPAVLKVTKNKEGAGEKKLAMSA